MKKPFVVIIGLLCVAATTLAQTYERLLPYYPNPIDANEHTRQEESEARSKQAINFPLYDRFLGNGVNSDRWQSSGVVAMNKAVRFDAIDAFGQVYTSNPGNVDTCDILTSRLIQLPNLRQLFIKLTYSTGPTWQTGDKLLLQIRNRSDEFMTIWESENITASLRTENVALIADSLNPDNASIRFVCITSQNSTNTHTFSLHGFWFGNRASFPFREAFTNGLVGSEPSPIRWSIATTKNDSDGPGNSWLTRFDAKDEAGNIYQNASGINASGDTLQSLPIDLSSLTFADSVYLSFSYKSTLLTRPTDTLILEAFTSTGAWSRIWTGNATAGNNFSKVSLSMNSAPFRHINFQFRFRAIVSFTTADSNQFELASIVLSRKLYLPFVEDFSASSIVPNSKTWQTNHTFVNADFAINPPSVNVATFDGMNASGAPYGVGRGFCDTLWSHPFDLSGLRVSDSVYLSFMVQPRGWGEAPNNDDLLMLFIRNSSNDPTSYTRIWQTGTLGLNRNQFTRFDILVEDSTLFHDEVELLFLNTGSRTGNVNHWHIDYIRFDRGRTLNDDYRDVAVTTRPRSLLTPYYSMPWNHFQTNPAGFTQSSQRIFTRNHFQANLPILYGRLVKNQNQNVVDSFANPIPNFTALSDTNVVVASPVVLAGSFNTDTITFFTTYRSEIIGSTDNIPSNDELVVPTYFSNFFSYDDGTAESGYGIDIEPGAVALGFDLAVPDSLYGIAIHFNRAFTDVSSRTFDLVVWRNVATNANGTGQDVIRRYALQSPFYKFQRNGFHYYKFDQPIALPVGRFFIGWEQFAVFNLNVGWDENYQRNGESNTNPNLFYKIRDLWRGTQLLGTPMIRPIVGKWIVPPTGLEQQLNKDQAMRDFSVKTYPNPAQNFIKVETNSNGSLHAILLDVQGKQVLNQTLINENKLHLPTLQGGIYFLQVQDEYGHKKVNKIIIQP
jgi:hypothetical protein